MSLEKRNGSVWDAPVSETQPHHKAGAAEYRAGLRRRAEATYRLPVLECGHHADPWVCRCHSSNSLTSAEIKLSRPEAVTDRYVDGYRDAAQHLLDCGLTPAPNLPAMRLLWRRGGADRRLVREISERWELAA